MTARIQLHRVHDDERVEPVNVAIHAISYFEGATKGWTPKAKSEALVGTRILVFTESFEEIAQKIDHAINDHTWSVRHGGGGDCAQ